MNRIPQSVTIRVPLKVFLTSDHVSPATGKTVAVVVSKNGAAFGNPSGGATNATETANGWYYVDLSTTDTGTTGPLIVRGTSAACDDSEPPPFLVVNAHNAGFDGVPNAAAAATGGVPVIGTGANTFKSDASANVTANAVGDLTATMKTSVQTAADAAVTANTLINTIAGYIDTEIAAIKAKTDNLPSDPADQSLIIAATDAVMTRIGLNGAGLTALGDSRIANLDAAVSSRMATFSYTTPPTTGSISIAVRDVDNTSPAAGSLGAKVNSAASAGDPMATVVPGSYASGTAGYAIGNNLNAKVGDVKAKTDNLPADPAGMAVLASAHGAGSWGTATGFATPGAAMTLTFTQAVPTSNTAGTVGDALNAARAQGFGKWVLDVNAKTLTLYASDGTTVVRMFDLDDATTPTTRS